MAVIDVLLVGEDPAATHRLRMQIEVRSTARLAEVGGGAADVIALDLTASGEDAMARLVAVLDAASGRPVVIVTADEQTALAALEREQQAAVQLRRLGELKEAFIAAVSHELRTPLTAIMGFAHSLKREELRRDAALMDRFVDRMISNVDRLERLLGDLLDIDRLSRGVLEAHARRLDVGELVGHVVESAFANEGDRIRVERHPAVAEVDASKVERIVEHLITNAIRHTPSTTPIWIRVRPARGGVTIVVEDAGPGISRERRAAAFDPFERGGEGEGLGIGLALVARFAALHGGRAWAEERLGGGASMHVFLPSDPPSRGEIARLDEDLARSAG